MFEAWMLAAMVEAGYMDSCKRKESFFWDDVEDEALEEDEEET